MAELRCPQCVLESADHSFIVERVRTVREVLDSPVLCEIIPPMDTEHGLVVTVDPGLGTAQETVVESKLRLICPAHGQLPVAVKEVD
jgi:hypothetical protein